MMIKILFSFYLIFIANIFYAEDKASEEWSTSQELISPEIEMTEVQKESYRILDGEVRLLAIKLLSNDRYMKLDDEKALKYWGSRPKEGEVLLLVRGLSSTNTNGGFYIRSGVNNILVGYGCLGTEGDKIKSPVVISLSSKKINLAEIKLFNYLSGHK